MTDYVLLKKSLFDQIKRALESAQWCDHDEVSKVLKELKNDKDTDGPNTIKIELSR